MRKDVIDVCRMVNHRRNLRQTPQPLSLKNKLQEKSDLSGRLFHFFSRWKEKNLYIHNYGIPLNKTKFDLFE